jgi:hypothetical protein
MGVMRCGTAKEGHLPGQGFTDISHLIHKIGHERDQ